MRLGAILAVLVAIAAFAVVSGANRLPDVENADPEFVTARAGLDESLERAGARLAALGPPADLQAPDDPGAMDMADELESLAARRVSIERTLDSLAADPGDSWRGAMAGIRANVAGLEARIDRAWILSIDSIAGLDAFYLSWLADAEARLDALKVLDPERQSGTAPHQEEMDDLVTEFAGVSKRLAELKDADDDPELRERLGEELISLRRRLRALERVMRPSAGENPYP